MRRTRVGLLWFRKLVQSVKTLGLGSNEGTQHSAAGSMGAAVVTVLEKVTTAEGLPLPEVVGRSGGRWETVSGRTPWDSTFWRDPDVVSQTIASVRHGLAQPSLWLLGEYEGGVGHAGASAADPPDSELVTLADEGLLPYDVFRAVRLGNLGCVAVFLRRDGAIVPILPYNQGFGHSAGARIAVFERSDEPVWFYNAWLSAWRSGLDMWDFPLCTSDDLAPQGCRAWLCPYGVENREHATIALSGRSGEEIAGLVASSLGLPLLEADLSPDEWRHWDGHSILPERVTESISA